MRYITKDGVETSLGSIGECIAAIGSGALTPDSQVEDATTGRWIKASEHPDIAPLFAAAPGKNPEPAPDPLRVSAWSVWAVALAVPPLVAAALRLDVANALGRALGSAVFFALIGAFFLLFVKNRTRLGFVLGLLFCLTDIGQLNLMVDERAARARLHASARNLESSLSAVSTSAPPASNAPQSAGSSNATHSVRSIDSVSEMFDLAAQFLDENKRLTGDYQRAAAAVHAETLLTPATLVSAAGISDAGQRVDTWMQFLDSYQQRVDKLGSNFEAKILALNLPEAQRSAFDSNFKAGFAKSHERLGRYFGVERELAGELKALYAFMGDRVGLVRVADKKLIFPTTADAETYSQHVRRVKELGAEEEEALKEVRKLNQEGVSALQSAAKQAATE